MNQDWSYVATFLFAKETNKNVCYSQNYLILNISKSINLMDKPTLFTYFFLTNFKVYKKLRDMQRLSFFFNIFNILSNKRFKYVFVNLVLALEIDDFGAKLE